MNKLTKTINLYMLKMIPEKYRSDIIRSKLTISEPNDEYVYKLAEGEDELRQAFEILHDSYVDEKYITQDPTKMRIIPHHTLPSTAILVCKYKGEVIATISILRDNPLKLPLEKCFDTDFLRKDGSILAEISSLAIKREHRGNMGKVLFPLINYTYRYAVVYFGVNTFVIVSHPKFEQLYCDILLFDKFENGVVDNYSFVDKGAPAMAFYSNLEKARILFAKTYSNLPTDKNLYDFFFEKEILIDFVTQGVFVFPKTNTVNINHLPMSLETFHNLVINNGKLNKRMSDDEIIVLENIYGEIERPEDLVLNTDHGIYKRKGLTRFDVDTKAQITFNNGNMLVCKVLNVSMSGLKLMTHSLVVENSSINVKIRISDFEISELVGTISWRTDSSCGVDLTNVDKVWEDFISKLEQDHKDQLKQGNNKKEAA